MDVRGIEGLTVGELVEEVKAGGRFVVFQACVGLLVTTVRRASAVYFVRQGESVGRGSWRSFVSAVLGWWALPWGPGQTIRCIRENSKCGMDVTVTVLRQLAEAETRGLGMTDFFESPRMGRTHAA